MRIGIDFDNTIVSYDELFHKVAVEQALVSNMQIKLAVRDYLRKIDNEPVWTELGICLWDTDGRCRGLSICYRIHEICTG